MDYEALYSVLMWLDRLLLLYNSTTKTFVESFFKQKKVSANSNGILEFVLKNKANTYDEVLDIYQIPIIKPNSHIDGARSMWDFNHRPYENTLFLIVVNGKQRYSLEYYKHENMFAMFVSLDVLHCTDRESSILALYHYAQLATNYSLQGNKNISAKGIGQLREFMICITFIRIEMQLEDGEISKSVASTVSEGMRKVVDEVERILNKNNVFELQLKESIKELESFDLGTSNLWMDILESDIIMKNVLTVI